MILLHFHRDPPTLMTTINFKCSMFQISFVALVIEIFLFVFYSISFQSKSNVNSKTSFIFSSLRFQCVQFGVDSFNINEYENDNKICQQLILLEFTYLLENTLNRPLFSFVFEFLCHLGSSHDDTASL